MIVNPLMGLNRWVALPGQVIASFGGRSSLPIHEVDKATVEKPYGRIRPFPASCGDVRFSAWRLAHAIKKADCARWPATQPHWTSTAGFLLENAQLFDWAGSELCLREGMADFYADFSASGLAGRIAQGMALLFLEEKGYAYVGRFETEWKRRAAAQNKVWPAGKKKAPDFIAENAKKEWVLAESKGGFASADAKPNIKGALRDGLFQLDGWDKQLTPQPSKSFAIGTFLRECGHTSDETSVIAFVDPEPEAPEDPVEFAADAVRRANYASWLALMGLNDAADRIRFDAGDARRRMVPVIALAGRRFAVNIASVSPRSFDPSSREFWDDLEDWPLDPFGWFRHGIRAELVGIDLEVLRALGSLQNSSKASGLMDLKPQDGTFEPVEFDGGAFYGSIFSDGSLLGELRQKRTSRLMPDFEWTEVDL